MKVSQPFTVSRSTIFMTLVTNPSTAWLLWCVLLIGIILCALGCFVDIRYLILGLIFCLTVIPTMAFFIFVNYMFASEMVANLLHHTIERREGSFLVHIYRPANQEDPIEAGKEWVESGKLSLFDSNIIRSRTTSEYDVIFFKDSALNVLYVPRYQQ